MTKPDSGLRAILKSHLTPLGFEMVAIESGTSAAGVSDLYWRNIEVRERGWIEAKVTIGWRVILRPHQIGFLMRERMSGGRAAIAVWAQGVGSGGSERSALWLLDGACASRLDEPQGLRGIPPSDVLGRWQGPPRKWNYEEIAEALLTC